MARTKTQSTELVPEAQLNPELENTQNLMAAVSSQFSDDRDLVNQLLGQAQLAGAFEDFSRTVRISKLVFVKENKLYRQIEGMKLRTGAEKLKGTWEEFCQLLGRSVDQVDRDISNLRAFGEEALESMSRMGIGYRELRQFRRLPEDQKSALIEVARDGDKTALLELAEEMIARHAKEKEDLKTDLDISRQTVAEKKDIINALEDEKEDLRTRLTRRSAKETPDEEGKAIEVEVGGFKNGVVSALVELQSGFNALDEHHERTGINHNHYMLGILNDLQLQLDDLRQQFNLPEYQPIDTVPDWVKESQENNHE